MKMMSPPNTFHSLSLPVMKLIMRLEYLKDQICNDRFFYLKKIFGAVCKFRHFGIIENIVT